jgi:hypothetical protein
MEGKDHRYNLSWATIGEIDTLESYGSIRSSILLAIQRFMVQFIGKERERERAFL